ncbi:MULTISPECIES: DUF3817 domain-containing protein [unclassified Janthinobacterium]|uniref:DUF3817 domain-containing protein n=1 Tax=unclassified Janthinobacterium TaxID=2610881 RepID=UPI0017F55726|nr:MULTISPECIES: DUF3817 domain-containing protein [unclassified Janthinobacterium]MBB5371353.1 integral membrane protein [Janthinobacterium sp. K2C7]MBB5384159.1 integral membrane protein [Janthinobacterium sp. K2Li3]MBB5389381.1 integral membrane protein [Janthinobacterium sp. K2E3]
MDLATTYQEDRAQLCKMRYISLFEGCTLLLLLGIAMPLKHLGGYPGMVSLIGPIHGLAFLLYCWMLVQTLFLGSWTRAERLRMALAPIIPFGALLNERLLARRLASLAQE